MIALILLTAAVTAAVTVTVYTKQYNKMIGDLPDRASQYALLQEADELIRAHYYGRFEGGSLDDSVIAGLVQNLGDPYNRYLSAAEYRQYLSGQKAPSGQQSCTCAVYGAVAYIRVAALDSETVRLFRAALQTAETEEVRGAVLDLRDLNAGDLEVAAALIDVMAPLATEGNGAIAVTRNASGETLKVYPSDSESVSLPLAVLINERTEGAAELIACDLRDFGKARLFGAVTAGHALLQQAYEMRDGSALLLTVCEVLPYIGGSYQGVGVQPDEAVAYAKTESNGSSGAPQDTQYTAAVSYLTSDK